MTHSLLTTGRVSYILFPAAVYGYKRCHYGVDSILCTVTWNCVDCMYIPNSLTQDMDGKFVSFYSQGAGAPLNSLSPFYHNE